MLLLCGSLAAGTSATTGGATTSAIATLAAARPLQSPGSIELSGPNTIDAVGVFVASGIPAEVVTAIRTRPSLEDWARIFTVHVGNQSQPAMLGDYRLEADSVVFMPSYGIEPGLTYRAVFRPAELADLAGESPIIRDFSVPELQGVPTTVVEQVFPSSSTLPENLLKLYLHFSAPMSRGVAYRYLSLLDPLGEPIELPFLTLEQELWDASGRRLTVLFDPGRIKSGLKPRREVGPALRHGDSFELIVHRQWPDALGRPLVSDHRKSFRVGLPDVLPPMPDLWAVEIPSAGTRESFLLRLGESLDHALLRRLVWITPADSDQALPGEIVIGPRETSWSFQPKDPWEAGAYKLHVDPWLEDLAGNRVGGAFEIDRWAEPSESSNGWVRRFVLGPSEELP